MSTTFQQSSGSSSPTKAKNIQIRRVQLTDPSQMPSDLSTTPGGTLFSTTPGGTRIMYDRSFLLECRNSPLAKSPPAGLPPIPGVTCVALSPNQTKNGTATHHQHHQSAGHPPAYAPAHAPAPVGAAQKMPEDSQFEMDI